MTLKKQALIVVAHPDDETIGCGGTIAKLSSEGYYVNIISVTNGSTGIKCGSDRTGHDTVKNGISKVRGYQNNCNRAEAFNLITGR